jgi:hypothetical protein
MCLIIASVCLYLSYVFILDAQYINASINGIIALIFIMLMIRNIKANKKYIKDKESKE